MQRYILTDYDQATDETREVFDDYMRTTGANSIPLWLKSLGHNSSLARAYWERSKGTLFEGNIPLPLKEMIVFVVSASNGANYCSACHAQCVLHLDKTLTFEDLKAYIENKETLQLPHYYRSVARFAAKVANNPNALEDKDFSDLMEEGFSKAEIGEIIAVIDLACMFNIYTSTLQLSLDPEFRAIL